MAVDLHDELERAMDRAWSTRGVLPWLLSRGINMNACDLAGGIGIVHASVTRSTGTFEPIEERGDRLLTCGCWHDGELVDLAGWRPADPARIMLRLGHAAVIGQDGVDHALATCTPLRLFRDAESWAKSGGAVYGEYPASVLLVSALAWSILSPLPGIIADDLAHGEEIEAALAASRPVGPPIRLPAEPVRAAA